MEFGEALGVVAGVVFLFLLGKLLICWWVSPLRALWKLRKNGFAGPSPCFPLGNLNEMKKLKAESMAYGVPLSTHGSSKTSVPNNYHSSVFPHFAHWQKLYGKVYVYWLGTEPFLYVAEPEFLRRMSEGVMGKSWGKPDVFRVDRVPMFGINGLNMIEGDHWVRHRHVINPAFSPPNLKVMASLMVDCATKMLNRWATLLGSDGTLQIDAEKEIVRTAGEIIAKTSFGSISQDDGTEIIGKLRTLQLSIFKPNRYIGVPFSQFCHKDTLEAKKLGQEIDTHLLSLVSTRQRTMDDSPQQDLLGLLLAEGRGKKALTDQELVDECKTFFFGGFETSGLSITWTLLMLAMHPQWQTQLRDEIREVVGDTAELEFSKLAGLKKMGWVMSEVLRLYPPAPNLQRQTREAIRVGDQVVPKGTNMWIDVVAMNHDPLLWGGDANEFRPERFKDDLHGGCKHKMGYLPFGFGGRMCVGRNLTAMEYKIVLLTILTNYSISLSPSYSHSPSYLFSLRPASGLPLLLRTLA